jgi:hypothetical protein
MAHKADHEYEEMLEAALGTAQAEVAFQKSLLDSFWTGDVPDDATLDHLVLAKAGRQRLEEKAKRCALLSPSS